MEGATGTINSAFDIFNKVIQQRQGFQDKQVANSYEADKQAYLDRFAGAKTPEEVAALEANPEVAAHRQRLSIADQAATRGVGEARTTSVRQNAMAASAYDAQLRQQREAPIRETAKALVAQGKTKEARALLEANQLSVESDIYEAAGSKDAALLSQTQAEQDRKRLVEVVRPREDETANAAKKLRDLNIKSAEQAALDADQARKLDARIAAASQQHRATMVAVGQQQGKYATEIGLPVKPDGSPDFASWNSKQTRVFNNLADKLKIPGAPGSGAQGDTARGEAFFNEISQSGEFSPSVVAGYEAKLRGAFNSNPAPLVGDDRTAFERDQRIEDNQLETAAKQFVPLNDPAATSTVANSVFKAIDDRFGADSWKAEEWRRASDKFLREGIVAKDGKGRPIKGADGQPIKVIPSADTMLRLLGTVDTGVRPGFLGGSRWNADDLTKTFEAYLEDQEVYRAAGAAVDADMRRSIRKINTPTQTPSK
jgi:hypothetical protein